MALPGVHLHAAAWRALMSQNRLASCSADVRHFTLADLHALRILALCHLGCQLKAMADILYVRQSLEHSLHALAQCKARREE